MYEIEAGERRSLTEEVLARTHNLVLKKEEEVTGGVRCFYGFEDNKQGFFEVIYLDDIVLDFKIHDDIVEILANESFINHINDIAEAGTERDDLESHLDILFIEPIGSNIRTDSGFLQKYGEKRDNKAFIKIHIVYDQDDLVVEARVVEEEVIEIDE